MHFKKPPRNLSKAGAGENEFCSEFTQIFPLIIMINGNVIIAPLQPGRECAADSAAARGIVNTGAAAPKTGCNARGEGERAIDGRKLGALDAFWARVLPAQSHNE